jgi:hypothetical protein
MPPKDSYIIEMNPLRKNMLNTFIQSAMGTSGVNPINAVCSYEWGAA